MEGACFAQALLPSIGWRKYHTHARTAPSSEWSEGTETNERRRHEHWIDLGWGGSIFLGGSQSHLYPHMRAKFGRGQTLVSKNDSLKFNNRCTRKDYHRFWLRHWFRFLFVNTVVGPWGPGHLFFDGILIHVIFRSRVYCHVGALQYKMYVFNIG